MIMLIRKIPVTALAAALLGLASANAVGEEKPAHDMQQMHEQQMHGDSIDQQVEKAKSSDEQEAVAKRFDQEAVSLEKQAAEHERLAKRYRGGQGVGPKGNAASLATHCDNFVKSLRASAAEAREMARLHHQAAEQLAK
jgi:hypothetical protein